MAQRDGTVFVYALLFGVSQDALTRWLDHKGSALVGGTESKNTPAADGSTAPPTAETTTTTTQ
jgi:hypothetical protein